MLGARQRRPDRLPAGRDPARPAGEDGWYDYEAKYTPGGMELVVPARIPDSVRERVRELAVRTFVQAGCSGMARVDFFVEGEEVLVNELNTIPGFTQTSVFGSLFEASGIRYPELLERLVALALERYEAERGASILKRSGRREPPRPSRLLVERDLVQGDLIVPGQVGDPDQEEAESACRRCSAGSTASPSRSPRCRSAASRSPAR